MSTVLSVVGARPQFVKAAVVSRALRRVAISEVMIHTGQHYDDTMSGTFFRELDIPAPAVDLGVGTAGLGHAAQTARMLEGIERELHARAPDAVLVYGDTNSTLAAALAAAKLSIPVVHVEAGLRSRNRAMPEEINRVVTDHLSELLLAPTVAAVENLAREGICGENVKLVGDVMYDAVLESRWRDSVSPAPALGLVPRGFALATVHRASNTDDLLCLRAIVDAFAAIATRLPVLWPVHPRTRAAMTHLADHLPGGIHLLPPVGYGDMMRLERDARIILTDSGGVQKEAYFHRVPCITLRTETEWVELLRDGWNRLANPADSEAIVQAAYAALDWTPAAWRPLYGEGRAGELTAEAIAVMLSRNAS